MDLQISKHEDTILDNATIKSLMGSKCDAVLGQLTEVLPSGADFISVSQSSSGLLLIKCLMHAPCPRDPRILILLSKVTSTMLLNGVWMADPPSCGVPLECETLSTVCDDESIQAHALVPHQEPLKAGRTGARSCFLHLEGAGGKAYSNYAVGYNNVDVAAATRHSIPVGNTPGKLMAVD